jgi:hypothetical protein
MAGIRVGLGKRRGIMKKVICVLVLLALSTLTFAIERPLGRADISFGFQVNGTHFAPGAYELSNTGAGAYRLRNVETNASITFSSNATVSKAHAMKLVFQVYSDRALLSEIKDDVMNFSATFRNKGFVTTTISEPEVVAFNVR